MITTEHVVKRYPNGFTAVSNLNISVNKADIYGFLGPNGAGKTTTIRMLTGLIAPSSGRIVVNGMDVKANSHGIKKFIGVLPESNGYYDWMTGQEYLALFAELYNVPKPRMKQRVNETLEWVGLSEKADVLVGHYSRGMRQRLGIAKAMIHEPSVVFLDEPTLGLDPQGQKDIQTIIRRLNSDRGVTVFITSHLLKEIAEICNRVAIVNRGTLVDEGELALLIHRYSGPIGKEKPSLEDVFFHLTSDQDEEVRK